MVGKEPRSFHTQAVVLRHMNYGEADRILTLFTLQHGKIKAIAKGVRRINSRKAGHLEPFTQADLFLSRGRDLAIITQADTINPFTAIKEDLHLMAHAAYLVELLERFTYEEGENRLLYNLLVDSFKRLSSYITPQVVVHYYELRLMDLLGFRPELQHCVKCLKEIKPEDQFFSAAGGGVYCPSCGRASPDVWQVSMPALKYLRHFQRSRYAQVQSITIPPDVEKELATLVEHYFTYLLERSLKTPRYMQDLDRSLKEE